MALSFAETATEKSERQVVGQLSILASSVDYLTTQVDKLESRLQEIVRVEMAGPDAPSVAQPEEVFVPLAETIRGQRRLIERANGIISSLLDRLEI